MEKQVKDKLFCHWDAVRFVSEKNLEKNDGTFFTLSVTIENKLELMIFLGKDEETNSCYEVKIYKSNSDLNARTECKKMTNIFPIKMMR